LRDYSKVSPKFWIGNTGKKIRACGYEAQIMAMYLLTCHHANMLGLYYLPKTYICNDTGIPMEGACKALKSLSEVGFCSYDEATEMVWVHEMAAYQIGDQLSSNDKRCAGVQNEYNGLPENRHLQAFFERYADAYHLKAPRGTSSPIEAPCEALASQEQEQEQEQEQDISGKADAAASPPPADLGPPVLVFQALSGKRFDVHREYIDRLQQQFPALRVENELRRMQAWLESNPKNAKTLQGMPRFIVNWLGRAQDRAPAVGRNGGSVVGNDRVLTGGGM
jgi:hypothetical protein